MHRTPPPMFRTGLLQEMVPLADLTTLEVGGPARYLAEPETLEELSEVLAMARDQGLTAYPLGDGSNLLASDEGFEGMLVRLANRQVEIERTTGAEHVRVRAGAGLDWDGLVELTVLEGLAGLECLSGIPGRVGACPIQNVGAYGQEVSDTLQAVQVLDLETGHLARRSHQECGFRYRASHFKHAWKGRYLVWEVEFLLRSDGRPTLRYGDLTRHFGLGPEDPLPSLEAVRQAVLEVRRGKSMVRDPHNPNSRSAGSFFTNPLIPEERAAQLLTRFPDMPVHPAAPGWRKLSAAWLIENAGFCKGTVRGRAGLSEDHVLALINRGGASAREILELAGEIRRTVHARFGVLLEPEPNLLGFHRPWEDLLGG